MASARKIGMKMAVRSGPGNGQCNGCLKYWSAGERMTAVATDNTAPVAWYCDRCIRAMRPPPAGCTIAPEPLLFPIDPENKNRNTEAN